MLSRSRGLSPYHHSDPLTKARCIFKGGLALDSRAGKALSVTRNAGNGQTSRCTPLGPTSAHAGAALSSSLTYGYTDATFRRLFVRASLTPLPHPEVKANKFLIVSKSNSLQNSALTCCQKCPLETGCSPVYAVDKVVRMRRSSLAVMYGKLPGSDSSRGCLISTNDRLASLLGQTHKKHQATEQSDRLSLPRPLSSALRQALFIDTSTHDINRLCVISVSPSPPLLPLPYHHAHYPFISAGTLERASDGLWRAT